MCYLDILCKYIFQNASFPTCHFRKAYCRAAEPHHSKQGIPSGAFLRRIRRIAMHIPKCFSKSNVAASYADAVQVRRFSVIPRPIVAAAGSAAANLSRSAEHISFSQGRGIGRGLTILTFKTHRNIVMFLSILQPLQINKINYK